MRINLVTPFAEKDAVKALGAHWDGARKVWYVQDMDDLTPFLRWIPQAAGFTATAPSAQTKPAPQAKKPDTPMHATTTSASVAHCGCDVLPWLDCVHTAPKS